MIEIEMEMGVRIEEKDEIGMKMEKKDIETEMEVKIEKMK